MGYPRFLALTVGLSAVLMLFGLLPTQRLGGRPAVEAMVAGCAISAVAGAVGALPVALIAARITPGQVTRRILGSMVLRLIVALGLGLAAVLSGWFAPRPLLIWLAIGYVVLLVADTGYALRALQRSEGFQ